MQDHLCDQIKKIKVFIMLKSTLSVSCVEADNFRCFKITWTCLSRFATSKQAPVPVRQSTSYRRPSSITTAASTGTTCSTNGHAPDACRADGRVAGV